MLRQTIRVYREPFITAIRFNARKRRVALLRGILLRERWTLRPLSKAVSYNATRILSIGKNKINFY